MLYETQQEVTDILEIQNIDKRGAYILRGGMSRKILHFYSSRILPNSSGIIY